MIGKLILIIGIIVMLLFSIGIPNLFILEGIATIIVVVVIAVANNLEKKADRPIKIVVLGPSNSGKTVFLASMFHRLSSVGDHTSFILAINDEERKKLVNVYYQLADPNKEFPDATQLGSTTVYKFDCNVRVAGHSSYKVLQFTYLDFAGEHLTNPNNVDPIVQESIRDANILMALLDGQKIFASMNGDTSARHSFSMGLAHILPILNMNPNPVHFVVTKWDIFQNQKPEYRLEQVITELGNYHQFRSFVDRRVEDREVVRLIPVSSVGQKFARMQKGKMEKIPFGEIEPFQVEMPLVCILPDYFEGKIKRLNSTTVQLLARLADLKMRANTNGLLLPAVFGVLFLLIISNYALLTISGVGQLLNTAISNPLFSYLGYLRSMTPRSITGVNEIRNQKKALEHTTGEFVYLLEKLEREFPASNLTRHLTRKTQ